MAPFTPGTEYRRIYSLPDGMLQGPVGCRAHSVGAGQLQFPNREAEITPQNKINLEKRVMDPSFRLFIVNNFVDSEQQCIDVKGMSRSGAGR
jgi:hypothetical protein